MSYLPVPPSSEYGLEMDDIAQLVVFATRLTGSWVLAVEYDDGAEPYIRLMAPWNESCSSAFLIERQAGFVVVTDRLSSLRDDIITTHPGMDDATETIRHIVLGTLTSCRGADDLGVTT